MSQSLEFICDAKSNCFRTLMYDAPDDCRLDVYLSHEIPELSRSRIQELIRQGEVQVNENAARASYLCVRGDRIFIRIPAPKEVAILPESVDFEIVYEDEDLCVVNKPRGLVVHPAAGHENGTLVNGLMHRLRGKLSGINGELRPGIVHRIDKDTSGLLMVCKTDRAHQAISLQLKEHQVSRIYQGIILGHLPQSRGTVDAPIGRMSQDRKKMTIRPDGRRAVTHFQVLQEFPGYSLVHFELETGRTHQIRVHMRSMNHPLLGDPVYGSMKEMGPRQSKLLALDIWPGQMLHAQSLRFFHPFLEKEMVLNTQLPPYFQSVLSVLSEDS